MPGSGITPREIESIRLAQEQYLPSTCLIYRRLFQDGFADYGPITTEAIPCRITPGFASLWRLSADKFQGLTAYTIGLPLGTDVKDGDKIYDAYGREFQVRDVLAVSSYHTLLKVLGEMIENG